KAHCCAADTKCAWSMRLAEVSRVSRAVETGAPRGVHQQVFPTTVRRSLVASKSNRLCSALSKASPHNPQEERRSSPQSPTTLPVVGRGGVILAARLRRLPVFRSQQQRFRRSPLPQGQGPLRNSENTTVWFCIRRKG